MLAASCYEYLDLKTLWIMKTDDVYLDIYLDHMEPSYAVEWQEVQLKRASA